MCEWECEANITILRSIYSIDPCLSLSVITVKFTHELQIPLTGNYVKIRHFVFILKVSQGLPCSVFTVVATQRYHGLVLL